MRTQGTRVTAAGVVLACTLWPLLPLGSLALPSLLPSVASAQDALDEPPEVTMQKDEDAAKPAPAPLSPEADRRARELFEQGRGAFRDGQYREAWGHFRDAYKLSKRPELLYNVGQSADRMRMDREALEAFRLYLKKLPNADNRKEVESRVRFLEAQLAREGGPAQAPATLDDDPDQGIDAYAGARVGAGDPSAQKEADDDELSEPGPEPEAEPEPSGIAADGQPTRAGWYFRLDLGLGLLADSLSETDTRLGAITVSGLFAIGYSLQPGFVIGGAITGDWGISPTATRDGGESEIARANFSTVGAFVDYYLAPRAHGWHLTGGLGFARLELSDMSAFVGAADAGGIGILVGGGHEWTVDRSWAIGAFGRVIVAFMGTDTASHTAFIPSVTFSAVWY